MNILGSERISAEFYFKKATKAGREGERERFGLGSVDTVQLKGEHWTHCNLKKKSFERKFAKCTLNG